MRRAALLICALPPASLLAGWLLGRVQALKVQCVMWRINNDADVFSWQLTSWLVDNCSERSVVFPLQC